ncbi:MAG: Fur family transcriptional regulator [Candidatus Thorarchaeota archaeon]|jgi:Fur family peroxide stress response transcriptional regulator
MNKEQLISMLRKNGHKVTTQRLAICEEVLLSKEHPTAEMVFEKVSKQHPGLSMTTVYHTLDMLKKLDLIHEIRFEGRSSRFDPNTSVHVNIICQKCGKISDYQSDEIQSQWDRIVSEIKVRPVGQRLDAYVICEECEE